MARIVVGLVACLALGLPGSAGAAPVEPPLVGQWTFSGASPLSDTTGHWDPLVLAGSASIRDGGLRLEGEADPRFLSRALGWASTSGYRGPEIVDKTLVAWVRVADPDLQGGGVLSLDTVDDTDVFDAIVYGERAPRRWLAGSNFYVRTQDVVLETESSTAVVQVARIDRAVGDGRLEITLCRDGQVLGSYRDAPLARWAPGNAEVVFGKRHTSRSITQVGGFEGDVLEARIYAGVLDCQAIGRLTPAP